MREKRKIFCAAWCGFLLGMTIVHIAQIKISQREKTKKALQMFYEEEKHALQVFGDFRDTQDVFGWETLNVGRTFLSLIRVSRGKKGSGALMETQERRHLNLQLLVSLQALRRWLGSLRPTQLFLFWFTLVVLVLMLSDAEGWWKRCKHSRY